MILTASRTRIQTVLPRFKVRAVTGLRVFRCPRHGGGLIWLRRRYEVRRWYERRRWYRRRH
ncbi:MAG: hypothetical protein JO037_13025 [Actinobacteria bacterium]|nr:hypothetical protein [Actinomycetota bacterium]